MTQPLITDRNVKCPTGHLDVRAQPAFLAKIPTAAAVICNHLVVVEVGGGRWFLSHLKDGPGRHYKALLLPCHAHVIPRSELAELSLSVRLC